MDKEWKREMGKKKSKSDQERNSGRKDGKQGKAKQRKRKQERGERTNTSGKEKFLQCINSGNNHRKNTTLHHLCKIKKRGKVKKKKLKREKKRGSGEEKIGKKGKNKSQFLPYVYIIWQ